MPRLRGKVVSGRADFGQWIERLNNLYEQKTGMRFYPGTLNVELSSEYSLPADVLRLEAEEYGGRVSVSIVPCRIFNRRAFLLRTDQNENGTDITHGISSRSPLTSGSAISINSRTGTGWRSIFRSSAAHRPSLRLPRPLPQLKDGPACSRAARG